MFACGNSGTELGIARILRIKTRIVVRFKQVVLMFLGRTISFMLSSLDVSKRLPHMCVLYVERIFY